jgi:hypothetical protein
VEFRSLLLVPRRAILGFLLALDCPKASPLKPVRTGNAAKAMLVTVGVWARRFSCY